MMELLRQWLVGITCAAMIVALADSLTPSGTVRKIGRMAGGLLLLVAVVQPILHVDFSVLAASAVQIELESTQNELEKTDLELMKTIIGEKTGAYNSGQGGSTGGPLQEGDRNMHSRRGRACPIPPQCPSRERLAGRRDASWHVS